MLLNDLLLILALLLMIAGLVFARRLGSKERVRNLHQRLAPHLPKTEASGESLENSILRGQGTTLPPALEKILLPLAEQGERLAGAEKDRKKFRQMLDLAGFRRSEAVGWFVVGKFACGLLAVLVLVFGVVAPADRMGLTGLAGGLIGFLIGSLAPEWWLRHRAVTRGARLGRSVPDALDLMVVCAEAGLPIGRVLHVVSKELGLSAPEMADELRYTSAELQILSDRTLALSHLAERTRVPEIENMVATLLQAERYGTPLSQALRTIADESRKTLILRLEEKAGKLPAQLSVPLMGLILPPIIAIMAAPALLRVIRLMSS
jgi:tight adherence protein C